MHFSRFFVINKGLIKDWACSSVVERYPDKIEVEGSIPSTPTINELNARAGKKEGGWGEGIFARPRFRRLFFRRRNFSYFALRNTRI